MNIANHSHYLQCPYCSNHEGGHAVRVPKTVGKYRVMVTASNIMSFTCVRCGHMFKYEIVPLMYRWDKMKKKEKDIFNKEKGGKK